MLRNAAVVLAILLVFGVSGLPASAFTRGSGYGGCSESDGFRENHLSGCFRRTPREAYGGYENRVGGFRSYGDHDMWGHWGAYYGPMI
ncbi:hypothetical protein SAMN05444158_6515 [Bradyrhizobium canariense]|uniref:Uncharacterized protein n=1 Tax=Bradyrhizobium canariense TaxID=255045 RepID=A0A1H2AVS9_9BRAD|nr:hypothetical protein SAMN05444158_6515 [Bradyrhizobium canariense]